MRVNPYNGAMQIVSLQRMREIDRAAIEEYEIPARVLMERAGLAVYEKLREMLPDGGSVAVVCGTGNNGGDGFVVARLAQEEGFLIDVLVAGEEDRISESAREVLAAAHAAGIQPTFADSDFWKERLQSLAAHDLIVDAVLGIGTSRDVDGPAAQAIQAINDAMTTVLSVDVPSGIETDTGRELGSSVVADATVTFGLPKQCFFQGEGLERCGIWSVADIGFPSALLRGECNLIGSAWAGATMPIRALDSNKGDNGSVLIVAGSARMRGAAVLCALAAIRAGAGKVTLAAPEVVCSAVAAHLPEAMLLPLPPEPDEAAAMIGQFPADVGIFGPGLGTHDAARDLLSNLFRTWDRPALVDADALTLVAGGISVPRGPTVLTPHPGEMGRLLGSSAQEVQADRFAAAADAANRFGSCVLLKGRYSIVSATGRPTMVNSTGNPGMATGGMGDVLCGVIGALMGQGLDEWEAASLGMYWHGLAGDLCATGIGSVGYTPTDLALALPLARDTILERTE
jgi:ADP-dependent NAD(P)H-hydrate dehydratase / NAD(P)H-hydrate epimerase